MAAKSKEPKPARELAGDKPSGKPRKRSVIDPKTGRVKPGAIAAEKAAKKKAAAPPKPKQKPGRQPGQITITKKNKTAEERKADRDARKKKAADEFEIKRLKLRTRIMGMREQGASIRQISEQLISTGENEDGELGCKPTSVFNHLVDGLEELWKACLLSTKNYAQLRLNQMQRIELAHFKRLQDPNVTPDNFEKLTRGMDRIWKRMDDMIDELTGRNRRPIKIDIDAQQTLAKLLGRSPEELPSGDAES